MRRERRDCGKGIAKSRKLHGKRKELEAEEVKKLMRKMLVLAEKEQ